ncbi:MAG: hypothetical protein HQM15_09545 [Deltaproteobacteria bacterium]|nr:hypothetical protein [Deltaproteobacteria bacterium]
MASLDTKYPEMKLLMNEQNMMLTEMEKILVDASLAYDVGLQELSEAPPLSADEVTERLEQVKELYFSARNFLSKYDPDKLQVLEQGLRSKKQVLQPVYHA